MKEKIALAKKRFLEATTTWAILDEDTQEAKKAMKTALEKYEDLRRKKENEE